MQQLYEAVMLALVEIKDNEDKTWNSDSSSKESTLFDACSNFKFLMALVVCKSIVSYTVHLTRKLQCMSSDVLKVYNMLEVLKSTLAGVQKDIDNYNKTWFDTVRQEKLIDKEFVASKPRTNRKQAHRPNHKADTPLDYYRSTLTILFIDHVITELNLCFNNSSRTIAKGFLFMPSKLIPKVKSGGRATLEQSILRIC